MAHPLSDRRSKLPVWSPYLTLAVILAGAAFLRFWKIGTMFHFMGDEGTQSGAEWRLLHGHWPLLGPSLSIGSAAHPLHLGPLFYYLMAPGLWIAGGSPVGPTVTVGIFGVATVALLFFYLRAPLGDWPALGGSAVMAASFLMVEYSRRPWNPTITPFFTLVFLGSLVLWKRRSSSWLLPAAGSLACVLQLQPVNLFLVAVFVIFILLARPPMPSRPVLGLAVLIFLAISSPLIIYDATHHLANTRAWLNVLLQGKSHHAPARNVSSLRLLFNLFNRAFGARVLVVSLGITAVVSTAALWVALVDHEHEGDNWELILPLILLLIATIGFEVYHKQIFEQYMVCLFVVPFIFVAAFLRIVWRHQQIRALAVLVVLALVAVGARDTWVYSFRSPRVTVADAAVTTHDLQPDDPYGHVLTVSRVIERWSQGRPFELQMASPFNSVNGYAYVLARAGFGPRPSALTYLLLEPPTWPRKYWPSFVSHEVPLASRSETIGIVTLYQIGHP